MANVQTGAIRPGASTHVPTKDGTSRDGDVIFATIEAAIEELKAGRLIVVVDDEDRENEGDLTMAAEMVTPEAINFMAMYGRGADGLSSRSARLLARQP